VGIHPNWDERIRRWPPSLFLRERCVVPYKEKLSSVEDIETMKIEPFSNLVPFRFVIKTEHKEELCAFLEKAGIVTRSFFYPMHKQPRLQEYRSCQCANTEMLYQKGICLPIHHHLQDKDVEYICSKIVAFFELKHAYVS
jgi:perosamine synthetase